MSAKQKSGGGVPPNPPQPQKISGGFFGNPISQPFITAKTPVSRLRSR